MQSLRLFGCPFQQVIVTFCINYSTFLPTHEKSPEDIKNVSLRSKSSAGFFLQSITGQNLFPIRSEVINSLKTIFFFKKKNLI